MDYEELRDILEIKPEEYRPFGEFKRWVLERSRKEMMDKNDIYFDYEAIRATSSQKSDVAKIVFHIRNNPNHAEVFRQFQIKESQFAEWQQQYYIKRGLNASNDVKIAFAEATRKISATAHYFEENGHVKESEKDKLRASLGKKITNTEGTNDEVLFIQWAFEIKGVHIEKNKNKWQEVKRQNV